MDTPKILDNIKRIRELLIQQSIRWLHTHKSKISDYIIDIDNGIWICGIDILARDYNKAKDKYKQICRLTLAKCFYGKEAKKEKMEALFLFDMLGEVLNNKVPAKYDYIM